MNKSSNKIESLDGLRGLAAVAVVFNHYFLAFLPGIINRDPSAHYTRFDWLLNSGYVSFIFNGTFAVTVFFVLSGFVLSNKFYATGSFDAPAAFIKRYFRLTLPILGSVLLVFLGLKLHIFANQSVSALSGSQWLKQMYNFQPGFWYSLWQGIEGVYLNNAVATNYINVLWTMPIELFGSFLVFTLLTIFGKFQRRWVLYILLLLVLHDTSYVRFILGMIMADLWNSPVKVQMLQIADKGRWLLTIPVILLCSGAVLPDQVPEWQRLAIFPLNVNMMLLHDLGAVLLLFLALAATPVVRMLSTRLVRFIGRVSFSMYLLHVVVLASFSCWIYLLLHQRLNYPISFAIMMLLSIPAILLISEVFTKYVDDPAIKYSYHFYQVVSGNYQLSGLRIPIAPMWLKRGITLQQTKIFVAWMQVDGTL